MTVPVRPPPPSWEPLAARTHVSRLAVITASLPWLLAGCDAGTAPTRERGPDLDRARVVFATQDPATLAWNLHVVRGDGSGRRTLEHPRTGAGEDLPDLVLQQPRWSPDGERLIYRSTKTNGDDWYLVMVDSAGASRRVLTPLQGFMDFPEWSPRGDRILYHHGGILGGRLGVLAQTALVDTLGNRTDFFVEEEGVLFEGRRVFFSLSPDPEAGLYDAQWAPDGAHLVLVGFLDRPVFEGVTPEQVELFRVRISDGRLVERVSRNAVDEAGFVLSPDGRRLLLSRGGGAERRLLVGDLPDLALTEVEGPIHDGPPRWVADGRHVVFSAVEGLFLGDADGGAAIRIVDGPGLSWPDAFCPDCR